MYKLNLMLFAASVGIYWVIQMNYDIPIWEKTVKFIVQFADVPGQIWDPSVVGGIHVHDSSLFRDIALSGNLGLVAGQ